tara:strand:+ start:2252 stop:2581 length:330 start_codon:yes stop_codon:yes gene_type:complete
MATKLKSNEEICKPKYVDLLPILVNTFDLYNKDHVLWSICKFADQCEKKYVDEVHLLVDELTNVTMDIIRENIEAFIFIMKDAMDSDYDEDDHFYELIHNAISNVLGGK